MTEKKEQKGLTTGAGIAIAGFLVAVAILISNGVGTSTIGKEAVATDSTGISLSDDEHVYGDPDAEITLVEYSDFECPFCATFHPNAKQLVDLNPNVKWVYRHFPLSFHPEATPSAIASECVADLGGNDMFWEFSEYLFKNQSSLGGKLYRSFAEEKGLNLDSFEACIADPAIAKEVSSDQLAGQLAGVRGTPHTIMITPDGNDIPFSGALPLETLQQVVDQVSVSN